MNPEATVPTEQLVNSEITITRALERVGFGRADAAIGREPWQKRIVQEFTSKEMSEEQALESAQEAENELNELLQTGRYMRPVNHTDTKCFDGRCACAIVFPTPDGGLQRKDISDMPASERHLRPGMAGGVAASARVGLMDITGALENINSKTEASHLALSGDESMSYVVGYLGTHEVVAGGHSGVHRTAELSDCGALDHYKPIVKAAVDYQDDIFTLIKATYSGLGRDIDENQLKVRYNAMMERSYRKLAEHPHFLAKEEENGATALGVIERSYDVDTNGKPKAVTKELAGCHNELAAMVNFRHGTTLDQAALREELMRRLPDIPEELLPQAFSIDAWAIEERAKQLAGGKDAAEELLLSMLTYQFATAARLTDGSIAVDFAA